MLLASGLLFEVPVAMLALARIGVTSADFYIRHWRVAIVVIAVLAAALPGGDPFSMMLLMIPQIALYVLGIWLAKRFGRPPLWAREAWAGEGRGRGARRGLAAPAQSRRLRPVRRRKTSSRPAARAACSRDGTGAWRAWACSASASSVNSSTRSPSTSWPRGRPARWAISAG